MERWTKTNFARIRDTSPSGSPMQWRMARNALHSPGLGVSRFTYDPHARMPYGHRHREQEEIYVVVSGSGQVKLDDAIVELGTWDVLRVSPSVIRSFQAGSDGLDLICVGGRRPARNDSERFVGDDFWDGRRTRVD